MVQHMYVQCVCGGSINICLHYPIIHTISSIPLRFAVVKCLQIHTLSLYLSLTHTLSLSHTHTLSLSLSLSLSHTHTHTHTLSCLSHSVGVDFERQFPPSEAGGVGEVRAQRFSHSSLLNGVLPPLDSPLHEEGDVEEDPILPPPAAFQGSTYIGEVDPVHSPQHRERGSSRRHGEVCVCWLV